MPPVSHSNPMSAFHPYLPFSGLSALDPMPPVSGRSAFDPSLPLKRMLTVRQRTISVRCAYGRDRSAIVHDGNREYYRMRAQEERRRADRATGSAARSHLILAANTNGWRIPPPILRTTLPSPERTRANAPSAALIFGARSSAFTAPIGQLAWQAWQRDQMLASHKTKIHPGAKLPIAVSSGFRSQPALARPLLPVHRSPPR